jgi:hypothetical protein
MSRVKLVDPKSYELAEYFLPDINTTDKAARRKLTMNLAQDIQQAIEDWISSQDFHRFRAAADTSVDYCDQCGHFRDSVHHLESDN